MTQRPATIKLSRAEIEDLEQLPASIDALLEAMRDDEKVLLVHIDGALDGSLYLPLLLLAPARHEALVSLYWMEPAQRDALLQSLQAMITISQAAFQGSDMGEGPAEIFERQRELLEQLQEEDLLFSPNMFRALDDELLRLKELGELLRDEELSDRSIIEATLPLLQLARQHFELILKQLDEHE